jgi:hypothetical protein
MVSRVGNNDIGQESSATSVPLRFFHTLDLDHMQLLGSKSLPSTNMITRFSSLSILDPNLINPPFANLNIRSPTEAGVGEGFALTLGTCAGLARD